jgi:hypothetical protein
VVGEVFDNKFDKHQQGKMPETVGDIDNHPVIAFNGCVKEGENCFDVPFVLDGISRREVDGYIRVETAEKFFIVEQGVTGIDGNDLISFGISLAEKRQSVVILSSLFGFGTLFVIFRRLERIGNQDLSVFDPSTLDSQDTQDRPVLSGFFDEAYGHFVLLVL